VGADADFTVFDDGSTDGTAAALAELDLPITYIAGDGTSFWARGMAQAEAHVLSRQDCGYIVWLNDDVELDGDALDIALTAARIAPTAVLVGAMRNPTTGDLTYSGQRKDGLHPLNFTPVEPDGKLQVIDTFNGNLVFVPLDLARVLGGIDGSFSHSLADIDYGIRVRNRGFDLLLLPRIVGSCERNPTRPPRCLIDDWLAFISAKGGGNYSSMKRILQKLHPKSWLGYVAITYSLWWFRRLASIRPPTRDQRSRPM
jgi:GT2 family glycosyltransferase